MQTAILLLNSLLKVFLQTWSLIVALYVLVWCNKSLIKKQKHFVSNQKAKEELWLLNYEMQQLTLWGKGGGHTKIRLSILVCLVLCQCKVWFCAVLGGPSSQVLSSWCYFITNCLRCIYWRMPTGRPKQSLFNQSALHLACWFQISFLRPLNHIFPPWEGDLNIQQLARGDNCACKWPHVWHARSTSYVIIIPHYKRNCLFVFIVDIFI